MKIVSFLAKSWRSWDLATKIGVVASLAGLPAAALGAHQLYDYYFQQTILPTLPGGTGWLLLGNYSAEEKRFVRGPFFSIVKSRYETSSEFPREGDIIRITHDRNLIIPNFREFGLRDRFREPYLLGHLDEDDYTGIVIREGAYAEVRSSTLDPVIGVPRGLWVRIGRQP